MLLGIFTSPVRFEHPLNALFPNSNSPSDNFISPVIFEHPLNAPTPILTNLDVSIWVFQLLHLSNALSSTRVNVDGKSNFFKPVIPSNI